MKKWIVPILYELSLWCLASVAIPKMIFQKFFRGKYKNNLLVRLGWGFPEIPKNKQFTVWAHAVSLGETKAILPLLRLFKKRHPDCLLIVSSITETGHAEAQKGMPEADYHVYLPFDFRWKMGPLMKKVQPDVVLLSETDFWYNFLNEAKKNGAKLFLVNGKISLRSMHRFQWFSWFSEALFSLFDHLFVQSAIYAERFKKIAVSPSKISIMGNMKLDGEIHPLNEMELGKLKNRLKLRDHQPVIVVGSTHDPEERRLLFVFKRLWQSYPQLKVILVPRHSERFGKVAELLAAEHIRFIPYSRIKEAAGTENVILIDAMGLLKDCYQICDIAIVAGSYTAKVGGHNVLEPSFYGKPVIYGPHHHSQPDLVAMMEEFQAGKEVPIEQLEAGLEGNG